MLHVANDCIYLFKACKHVYVILGGRTGTHENHFTNELLGSVDDSTKVVAHIEQNIARMQNQLIQKGKTVLRQYPIITFVLLTFFISFIINPVVVELLSICFSNFNFSFPMGGFSVRSLIAQYGGCIAACIVVIRLYGFKGWKSTLTYSRPKSSDILYLVISLFLPVILIFLSYLLAGAEFEDLTSILSDHWRLYLLAITGHLIASGLAEEYGWRGFMLPQLLKSLHPLSSTFIIYGVVCVWHFPGLLTGMKNESLLPFLIIVFPITIIHNWLFLKTRGSLLAPILFHATFDAQYSFFSHFIPDATLANQPFHQGWTYIFLYCLTGLLLLVFTKGRLGFNPSTFSLAKYFADENEARMHSRVDDLTTCKQ